MSKGRVAGWSQPADRVSVDRIKVPINGYTHDVPRELGHNRGIGVAIRQRNDGHDGGRGLPVCSEYAGSPGVARTSKGGEFALGIHRR